MKRLMYSVLPAVFSVLTFAAIASVKPFCSFLWFYQPEVPAALKK